ncbi:MAG TPA: GlsB/YeaQ/YmgE family stress response membrane protein [Caulobacter sp.]|nr:GlsB/YeaQ/YmgE family stress response membrane protein [Caulobacter sp.]
MDGVFWGWIGAIIIGIIAGWIAEKIMRRDHGLLTNLIVGLIGGVIGKFLIENVLGKDYSGTWWSLLAATIGAVILLFILGLFKRRA